jgi:hypothetical protein
MGPTIVLRATGLPRVAPPEPGCCVATGGRKGPRPRSGTAMEASRRSVRAVSTPSIITAIEFRLFCGQRGDGPRPVCTGGGETRGRKKRAAAKGGGARAGACQRAAAAGAAVRAAGACNFRIPGRTPLLFLGSTLCSLSRRSSSSTCAAHAQHQAPQRARETRDSPGQGGRARHRLDRACQPARAPLLVFVSAGVHVRASARRACRYRDRPRGQRIESIYEARGGGAGAAHGSGRPHLTSRSLLELKEPLRRAGLRNAARAALRHSG